MDAVNISEAFLASSPNVTEAVNNLVNQIKAKKSAFSIYMFGGSQLTYNITQYTVSKTIVNDIYGNQLYDLTAPEFCLNSSLETTTTIEASQDNPLETLGDCYQSCKQETSFECASFSFCRDTDNSIKCLISSKLVYDNMPDKKEQLVPKKWCSTFAISYLSGYIKMDGDVITDADGKLSADSANTCAKMCSYNTDFTCKSFQFCQSGQCFLRRQHFLNFKTESIDENEKSKLTGCAFYTSIYFYFYYNNK